MSAHVTFGGYRNRKRIARPAIQWFLQHRKLNRFNTFIHVVDRRMEDDGACVSIDGHWRPRYFEVEMDNRLNPKDYLSTLFHELVHVEQRLRGTHKMRYDARLCRTVNKWKGKVVPPETAYMDEPWEVEAYGMETQLYAAYREYETNLKN